MSKVLFYEGIRCIHPVYGYGTIISNNHSDKVRIHFDNGHEDNFTIVNLIRSSGFETLPEETEGQQHIS